MPLSEATISVVAGGLAGAVETTISYPLDLAKTRQQLEGRRPESVFRIIPTIARQRGVSGLFSGLSAPLVSEVPRRALKFGANGMYRRWAATSGIFGQSRASRVAEAVLCGGVTGATETVLHTPFERIKAQLQVLDPLLAEESPVHPGPLRM